MKLEYRRSGAGQGISEEDVSFLAKTLTKVLGSNHPNRLFISLSNWVILQSDQVSDDTIIVVENPDLTGSKADAELDKEVQDKKKALMDEIKRYRNKEKLLNEELKKVQFEKMAKEQQLEYLETHYNEIKKKLKQQAVLSRYRDRTASLNRCMNHKEIKDLDNDVKKEIKTILGDLGNFIRDFIKRI